MDNYQWNTFMQTSNLLLIACSSVLINELWKKKNPRKRPTCRVNPYLQERNTKGRFATDFEDLKKNKKAFKENFHMSVEAFHSLFELIEPHLQQKRNSRPNDSISPMQKLAIVLEYFASGDLQRHTASCYRISKQHFGSIIDLVCEAICKTLKPKMPELKKDLFIDIANGFNAHWNFPNCIGAIDGKHVALKAPPRSGSMFFNYKGFHSIVIMAVCDASYRFTYFDIGAYGSEGDANIFKNSKFGRDVVNDSQDFPENAMVNGVKLPFFYIGDDAFPLSKRILKPYSSKKLTEEEQVFNYRLSRARRCIENCFGILCSKWLCLKKTLFCGPHRAQKIIAACCLLHNFLIDSNQSSYCPINYSDRLDDQGKVLEGEWRMRIGQIDNSMFTVPFLPILEEEQTMANI